MVHSSAVGLLVVALCLVTCMCASAAAEVDEKDQALAYIIERAKEAVEAAIKSIKGVSDKAQSNITNASVLLKKVELFKTQAEELQSKAVQVAQDNKDASGSLNKIKSTFNHVSTLHQGAKEKLKKTISILGELLKDAEKVKGECDTELSLIKKTAEEYKDTKNKVPNLKRKVGVLETNMTDILKNLDGVQPAADKMEQYLKEAQPANLHVSVIVAVAKIQTMIKEADSNVEKTQKYKEEVNDIVEQIQTLRKKATSKSIEYINDLYKSAEDELTKAISAVEKAKTAKEAIRQQKVLVDAALTEVKEAKKIDNAQEKIQKAEACVATVKKIVPQLQSALQTAQNSTRNAKVLKQKLETFLSTTTSGTSNEKSKIKVNASRSVGHGTGPDRKDGTIQPTISVPLLVALIASAALQ